MKQVKNYCTRFVLLLLINAITIAATAQSAVNSTVTDQYDNAVEGATVKTVPSGATTVTDSAGAFSLAVTAGDSIQVDKPGFEQTFFKATGNNAPLIVNKSFGWKDLLNPLFY